MLEMSFQQLFDKLERIDYFLKNKEQLMESYGDTIVIDLGTGYVKAGFAGEDSPRAVFPNCVGYPKYESGMIGMALKEVYIGDEAESKKGVLHIVYPIRHGIITDWVAMEKILYHLFYNELRVDPSEKNVLITEAPLNPDENREELIKCLFEKFKCRSVYVAIQAVLSLYASGRTTGVVLDSGDGVTHVVPIFEGFSMPFAVMRLDLAGRDITNYLLRLTRSKGHQFQSSSEKEILKDVKEKLCYVPLNYEAELALAREKKVNLLKTYEMPDASIIGLDVERFKATEILFNPNIIGLESDGIHTLLYDSIMKCDIDIRNSLLSNIVVSGGNTLFKGFPERLEREMRQILPKNTNLKIISASERKYSVWIGGSILSSLQTFQTKWISREEYDFEGPSIVHRKCF